MVMTVNTWVFKSTRARFVAGGFALLAQAVVGGGYIALACSGGAFGIALMAAGILGILVLTTLWSERFGAEAASCCLFIAAIVGVLWLLPSRDVQFGNSIGGFLGRDLSNGEFTALFVAILAPVLWSMYILGKSRAKA